MLKNVVILGSLIMAGCASAPKPEESKDPDAAFYTLRSTNLIDHPSPLPNQSTILVDWKMSDGSVKTSEGFRGWDIDRDGRFDMLEVLAADGTTTAWAYDFDGDGKIDILQATAKAALTSMVGPAPIPSKEDATELLQLSH